jgi:hypothetical protein
MNRKFQSHPCNFRQRLIYREGQKACSFSLSSDHKIFPCPVEKARKCKSQPGSRLFGALRCNERFILTYSPVKRVIVSTPYSSASHHARKTAYPDE